MKYFEKVARFVLIIVFLISQAAPKFLWIVALGLFAVIVTHETAAIVVMFSGLWLTFIGYFVRIVFPNLITIVDKYLNE